jgi:hypothetical protein
MEKVLRRIANLGLTGGRGGTAYKTEPLDHGKNILKSLCLSNTSGSEGETFYDFNMKAFVSTGRPVLTSSAFLCYLSCNDSVSWCNEQFVNDGSLSKTNTVVI